MMNVAFTFDDGLNDHIEYAVPILEKYGYRGIFCIITDRVGKDGYMTWDNVRELVRRGHEVAAHSISHKNLYDLWNCGDLNEIQRQIKGSIDRIGSEIISPVRYFAFPHNAHNGALFKIVRALGVEPLTPSRMNLGGPPADGIMQLGKRLSEMAKRHERHAVLMFHGIASKGCYATYGDGTGDTFERCIADVKKYDGHSYKVVRYGEAEWPIEDVHSLSCRIKKKIKRIFQNFLYGSLRYAI
jgi:peptidoglycan/xylan/chitin deacetylase (PgdA/CDA1 family)